MAALRPPMLLAAVLLFLGCSQDQPFPFEQKNLGVSVTFPGEPRQAMYPEETPFGTMQWYNFSCNPSGRLDLNFHVDVGNLPKGTQGGDSVPAALATFEAFLSKRLGGPIHRTDLPASRGQGFAYDAPGTTNAHVEGIVILKAKLGRLYHAQATVERADDPRLRTFLDTFAVTI